MSAFLILVIVLLVILGALIFLLTRLYNQLVILKNRYINAYSQIDVQLKRRYDLIPNLVESCRAYLAHESSTLEAVIQARNMASIARSSAAGDPTQQAALKQLTESDNALSGLLGKLMMVVESYPELKANQTVSDLMEDLRTTENRISFSRQAFNDAVMEYNQSREVFPAVLFVNIFGFQPAEFWRLESPAEGQTLRIQLDKNATLQP
ncbi:MAG: LemA family protein [Deltaproteobacteria bacterium]|jgi:LemA protein|nr:LemA family protein [Deltaproteobacteria bacterium]